MAFGLENYITNEYLRALVILVGVFITLRIIVFITEKIVLVLTKKTKTDVDDVFVKKSSKPFTILVAIIGLRIAIEELAIHERIYKISDNLLHSIIAILVTIILYHFIDLFLVLGLKKALNETQVHAKENLVSLTNSIMKILLAIVVLLYILSLWGVEIGPFLAGLGIAGLAVALALQPTLSNVFSGISMILDKTIKTGDLIYLDAQTKGKVQVVGLRSTRILTFDNELLIVPNNSLAESRIQNVALPEPKTRVVIPFGVAYGSNIEKVKKVVLEEISAIEKIEKKPKPLVRFIEMANSSLNFKAYFYVNSFEKRFKSIDEANTAIYNRLRKEKIEIPFPQMDVHVKK